MFHHAPKNYWDPLGIFCILFVLGSSTSVTGRDNCSHYANFGTSTTQTVVETQVTPIPTIQR